MSIGREIRRAALLAALMLLVASAQALAAPAWHDGTLKESQITNCASIIFGNPYTEFGTATYTGQYLDTNAPPKIGDIYYVHVIVYGVGNPCAGTYASVDLQLPNGTYPATQSYVGAAKQPIKCWLIFPPDSSHPNGHTSLDTSSDCRQDPPSDSHGYNLNPPAGTTGSAPPFWPIPQGGGVELQIPVISTKPVLSNDLGGYVQLADGNSSPTLNPTAQIEADDRAPSVVYPTGAPNTTGSAVQSLTSTGATLTGIVNNIFRGGTITMEIGTTRNVGGITSLYQYTAQPTDTANPAWFANQEWNAITNLQPGCTYNWRINYTPTGGTVIHGANQTFTTPGSGGNCALTPSTGPAPPQPQINLTTTTSGTPPAPPVTVDPTTLPPTMPNPPATQSGGGGGGSTSGGGGATNSGGGTNNNAPPAVTAAFNNLNLLGKQKGTSFNAQLNVLTAGSNVEVDGFVPAVQARKSPAGALLKVAKPVLIAKLTKNGAKAGPLKLKVRLNAKGKKALKKHHKLTITVVVKVTPPGGAAQTATKKVKLSAK